MKNDLKQRLEAGSRAILTLAGVYSTPIKGSRSAGFSRLGAEVFTLESLANSIDLSMGRAVLHSFASLVYPFNVLSKKEKDAISTMEKVSGNPRLIAALDKEHQARNGESFVVTILKAVNANGRHALGVLAGAQLYDHWGVMSPAQKSIGIAVLAIQTHKTDEGGAVCDLKIIQGPDYVFYVRDALDLFVAGKNPYPLVEYWDQILRLYRVYGCKPSPETMADFATSHKLLGLSVNGSAVPGVDKSLITQNGGKPTPQYGVGALAIPQGKAPPQGYTKTAQLQGGDVIVPSANAATSTGALQGSLTGTKAGQEGISSDAIGVYRKWKPEDKKHSDKGADGGSALIAGFSDLKHSNPYLYGALVAFLARYADTSIPTDNAVAYAASLAGIALARIVTGRAEKEADNQGLILAKRIHDATPAEFAKIQTNIKALYANFGVSSKADAYQLTNQAYAEARINESDLVAMQEIFNIIYGDNGFAYAQKLLNGAAKGVQISKENIPEPMNKMLEGQNHKEVLAQMTKEEARKRNAARYANPQQQESEQEQSPQEEQQEPSDSSQEEGAETPSNGDEGSSFDNAQATAQSATPQMGATP